MNSKQKAMIESFAEEFCRLDEERLSIDRQCRRLKKRLKVLQESMQQFVGVPDVRDMPLVTKISTFFITQVKKHRAIPAYEFDFIEFKVVDSSSRGE